MDYGDEPMENVQFYVSKVDGSSQSLGPASGTDIITSLSDDWGAPVSHYVIEAQTDDGRIIKITFANDDRKRANISIKDKKGNPA